MSVLRGYKGKDDNYITRLLISQIWPFILYL